MPPIKDQTVFGVVILGAGASSRMGRPKLLLPWRDTTVIGHLSGNGANSARRKSPSSTGQTTRRWPPNWTGWIFRAHDRIENPQPERGMFSSILCAANWPGWKEEIAKLGHRAGRPAAFASGNAAAIAGISFRARRRDLPAGI